MTEQPPCLLECETEGANYCDQFGDGFFCTRLEGHEGPHVACGSFGDQHALRVWPRDQQSGD